MLPLLFGLRRFATAAVARRVPMIKFPVRKNPDGTPIKAGARARPRIALARTLSQTHIGPSEPTTNGPPPPPATLAARLLDTTGATATAAPAAASTSAAPAKVPAAPSGPSPYLNRPTSRAHPPRTPLTQKEIDAVEVRESFFPSPAAFSTGRFHPYVPCSTASSHSDSRPPIVPYTSISLAAPLEGERAVAGYSRGCC